MSVTAVPIRPLARGSVLKLWLALIVLCVAGAALAWIGTAPLQIVTTATGVRIQTLRAGTGATITPADLVAMRYRLTKLDGTQIENSDDMGQPFVASSDRVFPGFGEAMAMMQQGGRYRIWLPPGQHAPDPIPPGTPFGREDTLVFDVTVLQVAEGMAAMQRMMGPQGGQPGAAPPGGLPPGAEGGGLPPGALPPGAGPHGEGLPPGLEGGPPAPEPSGRRRPGGNSQ
ncbi:FKBP-type peptidyl-prolyl cis-trans isomerase [Sphingosinicella sp.]|uniref:FKBP-type peptidyl-prolyl cis-trans isomerase n=1 Tax=Sphingosinicella sp. TaxID=1917971 RepID=UPI0040381923